MSRFKSTHKYIESIVFNKNIYLITITSIISSVWIPINFLTEHDVSLSKVIFSC